MNWLDLVIVIVVGSLAVVGFIKGLVSQAVSLAAVIVAIVFAGQFSPWIAKWLISSDSIPPYLVKPLSFFIVFILLFVAGKILIYCMQRILQAVSLSWLNRLAGAFFGALKGVLILSLVFNFFHFVNVNDWLVPHKTKTSSRFYMPTFRIGPYFIESLRTKADQMVSDLYIVNFSDTEMFP